MLGRWPEIRPSHTSHNHPTPNNDNDNDNDYNITPHAASKAALTMITNDLNITGSASEVQGVAPRPQLPQYYLPAQHQHLQAVLLQPLAVLE